ncbi:MAG: sigma-54-dependent Fis family transcriptional regulator [Pirellulaceae bacterium]|nr:sigma-54-dependent Fis family transcriptional regulator [Pirellulaceae bacterium]
MTEDITKILIVEDEQIVAVDIENALQRLGYQVAGMAGSAEEACRIVAESDPDLVLMDVRIDGPLDGIDAARRIHQTSDVPIVFLTAYTDEETLDRAKDIEPYGYLVKPFAERDLQAAIEVALYKGAADRRLRESHQNLQAILDAQRHGTIILDAESRVRFASRTIRSLTPVAEGRIEGARLRDLLPLSDDYAAALADMCRLPVEKRSKLPVVLELEDHPPYHLEIEIEDDPRDDGGKILFVYDVSSLHVLRRQLDNQAVFQNMLGKSRAMCHVFEIVKELGRVDSTVLIEGATGTGKELVARAIHQLSARRDGPFLALNCGGLSEELAASQLFGHRRGSFTGAVDDQVGLFEAAGGGTLFLDEIGELPPRVQASLLRVLEENAVMRMGESRLRPVNIRILAATHRDLAQEAVQERFRLDLLYRIRIARVMLPTLCERRDDLPLLVRAFLADHRASTGKQVEAVSDEAMAVLLDYDWPGNVRELRNVLEYAVVRCHGSMIQPDDLPPELLASPPANDKNELGDDETDRLKAALKWSRGNRTRAATLLGVSRATLYRRLKELGIDDS